MGRRLGVVTAVVGLAACSGSVSGEKEPDGLCCDTEEPAVFDYRDYAPSEAGPFRVGHLQAEVTYSPSTGEGPRTIPVHVWYPTEATQGEAVVYEGLFEDVEALGGAPPAGPTHDGSWPVLAHSHGSQGYAGNSAFLHAHFASHGWVVVGPDHLGNTFSDNAEPRPTAHYIHRPEDLSAALDAVSAGLFAEHGLEGVDVSRVVMSGHSFGVYTAWAVAGATVDPAALEASCSGEGFSEGCTEAEKAAFLAGMGDERVIATIPMAGSIRRSLFGDTGHASVTTPMLSLSGSEDPVGADDQFASCPQVPLTWVDIEGACHQTFALGVCGTLEQEPGFVLVETQALAFARYHLLGDTSDAVVGWVEGTSTDPLLTYQSHVFE